MLTKQEDMKTIIFSNWELIKRFTASGSNPIQIYATFTNHPFIYEGTPALFASFNNKTGTGIDLAGRKFKFDKKTFNASFAFPVLEEAFNWIEQNWTMKNKCQS